MPVILHGLTQGDSIWSFSTMFMCDPRRRFHTITHVIGVIIFTAVLQSTVFQSTAVASAHPGDDSAADEETAQGEDTEKRADSDRSRDGEVQAGPRALSRAFRDAARKATPSVVTILSYGQTNPMQARNSNANSEDGGEQTQVEEPDENQLTGLGSGVIVSKDGMVITNNHVIKGAKRVVIQLPNETEVEATSVRGDADSDVATLRISRESGFDFGELGDSDVIEIGDWVLAIGSPFRLEATVSAGIISAKDRSLRRINRGRLIQTDAAINPGNSGGPLIDLDGRVIAISTAIATRNGGYQGVGFAIPINQAKWIADELAEHGVVRRAAIGIRMAELNPKIAGKFDLPPGLGVLAYQVIENSAAQRAGIKPLDVIMEFAGERVRDPASFQEAVERKPVGSVQEVKIYRKGEELTLEVELATVEDPTLQASEDGGEDVGGKEETQDEETQDEETQDDESESVE